MSEVSANAQINPLHLLNEELENYFENTIIPQLFVDANLVLRKFSPPAMKQFTLAATDIGKNMRDIGGNIRYPTFMENILEVITTGKSLEKEIQTLDLRWFQMNILPYITRKEKKSNGVIITFVDITDRIRTLKELEKLNLDHETLIYSVSHNIKQPLSVLSLLGDALAYAFEKHDAREFRANIDMLDRSLNIMKGKIDELTDLIKNISVKEVYERINIENIFEEVTLALKEETYNKEVTITTEFKISEIMFSRKNLRSILYNLLSNSIKYKKSGKPVEILIKTDKTSDYVILSVKDNGRGIESQNHEMIFERYARINDAQDGTGMGLNLVRTIVDNNEGKIEIESVHGEGSTFTVYFKN